MFVLSSRHQSVHRDAPPIPELATEEKMPTELPYLNSYKNVDKLFRNIAAAKRPETFSHKFLADTLGLKSTTDRPLIALLKTLGFVDPAGKPTADYDALKNPDRANYAIGAAVRRAYAPLFAANENAHSLSPEQLRGLISQVAGTDEKMTKRIGYTLSALLKQAKFGGIPATSPGTRGAEEEEEEEEGEEEEKVRPTGKDRLRTEFHYNIQIHCHPTAPKRRTSTSLKLFEKYSVDERRPCSPVFIVRASG
jgi:uncharacterized protein DUF5343